MRQLWVIIFYDHFRLFSVETLLFALLVMFEIKRIQTKEDILRRILKEGVRKEDIKRPNVGFLFRYSSGPL